MEYKKILVTGGAGLIGSHVVDELLKVGYKVRIMDNLGQPTHDGSIPPWLNKNAEFIQGDIRIKIDWQKALIDVDAIIHLAAYMDFHLDFSTYIRTNVESVALMFEVITENKLPIKKIIAASSQSVYGEGKYYCTKHGEMYLPPREREQLSRHDWEQHCAKCNEVAVPVAELENDLLSPFIPYAVSKLSSEQLLFSLGKLYNIPTVALRYSIVLGARQSFRHFYSGALRAFTVNVLNHEPISMNEDGQQIRDFVHVHDVAQAHLVVLQDARANDQIFNVGSGESTCVVDLAKIVAEVAGVRFEPLLTNRYRVGGARHSVMNVSKLKNLGWEPTQTLNRMVSDYLAWVRQFKNFSGVLKNNEDEMRAQGLLK